MKRTLFAALVAVFSTAGVAAAPGSATTGGPLCVDLKKPGCFTTIQAAVDAAGNGDTIDLGPGTFAGGMWTCLVIGLVASTTVFWDKILFGIFPFYDAWSFALGMLMEAGFCIGPGIIGSIAGAATNPDRATRA